MKHRYSSLIASSALMLSMVLAPTASFAAGSNQGQWGKGSYGSFASWFGFGAKVAHAETAPRNLPPSISGITAPTVLKVGAEGTWTVNASDPENGALSYSVDWGDRSMMKALLASEADVFTQSSSFTHTYAAAGTYNVKFKVKDSSGLTSSSSATVHVIADSEAIAVSDVSANPIDQSRAKVTWTTNVRGDSTVFFSTATPVDTSTALSAGNRAQVLKHTLNLTKLAAGTTYYFVVQSKDASGKVAASSESSFTTPKPANDAPSIQSISGPASIVANTEGTWTVSASDPENGSLSYSIDWGENASMRMMALSASEPVFTQTSTFSHTYVDPGTYTITVTAKDDAGLTATSKTTVVVTAVTPPPVPTLSGITALVGTDKIVFNWNTNEGADSEIYYSASSPVEVGGANTTAVTDATLSTSHALTVGTLKAGTSYYFIIESKNADGGVAATSQFSLTTMSM
ncbi:MAG: PKD domain-containing protein [Patescibacteria group bacterium]